MHLIQDPLMQKNNLNELLIKNMTRKEFLVSLSLGAVTITGIPGLLKKYSESDVLSKKTESHKGFGSGAYGK